jgi:uncharacterized protein YjbI with pentapeptide repeats
LWLPLTRSRVRAHDLSPQKQGEANVAQPNCHPPHAALPRAPIRWSIAAFDAAIFYTGRNFMNREESIALYERAKAAEKKKKGDGAKVWNAWAEAMLAKRAELERSGEWDYSPNAQGAWREAATADFSNHIFQDAEFGGYIFPARVNLSEATTFGRGNFTSATFLGKAQFFNTAFLGEVSFDKATFAGSATFTGASFSDDAWFTGGTFSEVWFVGTAYSGDAEFHEVTFSQHACFNNATFAGDAAFNLATFADDAWFRGTAFSGDADYNETTFSRRALFRDATFSGAANFAGATFSGNAEFESVIFEGFTAFHDARFANQVVFAAITSKNSFSVSGTEFQEVPDFMQATFSEAPRFDNTRIRRALEEPQGFWGRMLVSFNPQFRHDPDDAARYRALKALAIRAHDHDSEISFFAGEIVCRRGVEDFAIPHPKDGKIWPGGARYWAGQLYETLSDFGRSLVRPLAWWFYVIILYAVAYLSQYFVAAKKIGAVASLAEAGGWAWTKALSCIPWMNLPEPSSLKCVGNNPIVAESGMQPWAAASYVSIRRAFILNTGDDNDKLAIAYACLYGDYSEAMKGGDPNKTIFRVIPHIPDAVSALAIMQSLLSAALIFLFLLAVRNHFRIK